MRRPPRRFFARENTLSVEPGAHGGNLDNRLLTPGSTAYFRVNVPGAMFSAGDGHAMQGDGEFSVTALETSLRGTFRLSVIKNNSGDAVLAGFPAVRLFPVRIASRVERRSSTTRTSFVSFRFVSFRALVE